jgi:NAD(P)-dependent dehydrogenase (short-subunit alcohol dehydrogenase family)
MIAASAPPGLDGRVAVVTGASSGIGRATAMLLAERGARVLAVARNGDKLAALSRETGVASCAISIETAAACARTMEEARRLGPVAILVNCAGRAGYLDRPIWDQSTEDWRATMAVNLDAPFELTRLAVHDMRALGWGRIVMVGSTAGQVGAPAMSAYCASKHGLIGLMRSVAQDVAKFGVTCNAVLPGWVRTEMAERDAEQEAARRGTSAAEIWAERAAGYPAARVLEPKEVAHVIGFLVGQKASGVNGEAITVSLGGIW